MWTVQLVASISQQKPEFNPRPVHVRLVMGRVAMGYVMNQVLRIYPVIIIPPMLRTHLHLSATINNIRKNTGVIRHTSSSKYMTENDEIYITTHK